MSGGPQRSWVSLVLGAFPPGVIAEDLGADSDLLPTPGSLSDRFTARAIHQVLLNTGPNKHSTSLVNYLHKYLLPPGRTISHVKKGCHVDLEVFFSLSHDEFGAGDRGPPQGWKICFVRA